MTDKEVTEPSPDVGDAAKTEEEVVNGDGGTESINGHLVVQSSVRTDDADDEPIIPKHTHLEDIEATHIKVERVDTSSPLFSAKSWEDLSLSPELLRGLAMKGFVRPSKIQEVALPLIMNTTSNLIAQAQNGSGKTATFALAMLSKIDANVKSPQCLCLCPTRELARQNMEVIKELGKFTDVTMWLVLPQGARYNKNTGAQIVVGTPGKVTEMLTKRIMPHETMKIFVLDEADVMIDHAANMGPQVTTVRRFFKKPLQVLLFSATYPERVKKFATQMVPHANRIQVRKEELTLDTISQFYAVCDSTSKAQVLSDLYASLSIGQSVIFVNTRHTAFEVARHMQGDGHTVSVICGSQAQGGHERLDHDARERVMEEFRTGVSRVLIATDVLSRGIDVPAVTMVVNYDLPMDRIDHGRIDTETYIHRIGRTGRFGLKGLAINLVSPRDTSLLDYVREFYRCDIAELDCDMEELSDRVRNLRV